MSIQNRNNVVSSEYLRRGMRTPENRTYFKNSARSNGIKLSFDQSKSKLPYSTLSSPPKRPSLCQTRMETWQRWFLFSPNLHLKKIESIEIFIICFENIKNNSNINLDDGNHIRIVWFCSNAVKTHNVIFH